MSGATGTSNGVRIAVADALAQATGAETTASAVKDGTYTATAPGFSWTGMITADVTFKDGKLTAVEVTEEHETETGELFGMVKSTYIPRMIEHQSLAVDAVAGATASSNAIRAIVADAVEQAGGKVTDWYTPVEKKTDTVKLEGYDVIVVGMGGSGMLSFMAAADQGAKVIGLEKAGKLGGNSTTTTGPMALNSKYLNGGEPYINEDDVFDTWMEYVDGKKEAVVRRAVYESTAALEYYIENFDFQFDGLILSFAKPEWNKLWTRYVNDPATDGPNKLGPNKTYMYQRAIDKAIELSPESEYKLETTVTEMITDDDGNVVGVKAVNVDGTTYEVYGKSVILATGGYIANSDMMMDTFGATTQTLGCTLCTGDGIKLGQSVGGATYALDVLPMIHIEQVPNLIKNDDLTGEEKAILSAMALVRGQKAVNINGEAFDRSTDAAAECYVPGFRYYTVYTQEEIDGFRANGLPENFAAATSHFLAQGTFTTGTPVASIDKILTVGEKYGNVISGGVAELAEGIGCDATTLSEALGGDGTYYAVCCAGYAYATVGGLDVNENMNVLKADGTVIANLFAVGQDSEGVCNAPRKAYSPWGGQAQSWTFISGRIAGTQAAQVAGK
ncbi:MAG: FAD-binding protein [Oscillospiraceae bacterium]|nr:FAD-binding protein [Oscillospiraceae bacterium]